MNRLLASVAAPGLLLTMLACSGGSDSAPPAPASVRIAHASPDAPNVDILLNGRVVASDVPFKGATAFLTVPSGEADLKVNVAGTGTTALAVRPVFESGRTYTVMAADSAASLKPVLFQEDVQGAGAGSVKVRVVHAAPKAPRVDVYVTSPGASLETATPTVADVPFLGVSKALEVPAATYQIRITGVGSKAPVFDSGSVPLAAGADLVLAAVEERQGASPVTLLGLTRNPASPTLDVSDARALLRAKHASPDAPAVDILVNGALALPGVPFPAVSGYLPVSEGATSLSVKVAGTATTVLNADFVLDARKAYSAFAVDLVSKLSALVVEDDLRAPSAGKAKLRAVHLSPDAPNVDVWVNGAKVLSDVPYKTVSPYLEVPAGATEVKIAVAGTTTVVLQANPNLQPGEIFSAVAVGTIRAVPAKPLSLSLVKDR